jgi:hypothetical protein
MRNNQIIGEKNFDCAQQHRSLSVYPRAAASWNNDFSLRVQLNSSVRVCRKTS